MTPENYKTATEIIKKLILGNMKNGSGYEKAKDQTFNRLNKEFPQLLSDWCNHIKE